MGHNTGVRVHLQHHNERTASFSDRRGSLPSLNTLVIDTDTWAEMGCPETLKVEVEGV